MIDVTRIKDVWNLMFKQIFLMFKDVNVLTN